MNTPAAALRDRLRVAAADAVNAARVVAETAGHGISADCPPDLAGTIASCYGAALHYEVPTCPHLHPEATAAVWWVCHRPVRLTCASCTAETLRSCTALAGCDMCGVSAPLAAVLLVLPPLIGRHQVTGAAVGIPPVVAVGAVCRVCWGDAEEAG